MCAAAVAAAVAPEISSPVGQWACLLVRDLSLASSSFILVALGLRQVRSMGVHLQTLAYPVGGILIFTFLIGSSVWAHSVLQSSITLLGADAPAELSTQSDAIYRAGFVWFGVAALAFLVGLLTPVRAPAAFHVRRSVNPRG